MKLTDQDFLNAALRSDLPAFLHRSVLTLNPGEPFLPNWHLDAICYQLERVRRGEITRLIVNMPPRSLKSILVSVAFPAFLLGHDPHRKVFCISYGTELAAKHASDFRSIVQSRWYRQAFPNMSIARMADSDAFTASRGFRRTTSVNATLTGLGGDCFIIDDPLKPVDALSDALRTGSNDWFSNTLISRLDNKATGVIIVVMQRVHQFDLTGHLLENSSDWEVLSLPAIAETDEQVLIGENRFHWRDAGEALHPEREPIEVLEKVRRELGPDIFAAQYQQAPVPPGGGMIRKAWLRYYDTPPKRTYRTKIIQSWDTAGKGGAQNSWSACTTWMFADDHYYLLDVTRGRFEYPQLRSTAIALAKRFKPDAILIEDASTGIALAPDLRPHVQSPVKPIKVEHDKVGRLYVHQHKFEAGLVLFPKGANFLPALEAELLTFPQGKAADQVDSISQALSYKPSGYDSSLRWVSGDYDDDQSPPPRPVEVRRHPLAPPRDQGR
jgi:predicted phage terminase large subunit-like protein